MPYLASDVFDRARSLLNDDGGELYTDGTLLPYLKIANDELSDELVSNGISVQKDVEEEIPVPATDTELDLPDDLISPISCYERPDGSTDPAEYVFMPQKAFEPNVEQGSILGPWAWRDQRVVFVGATVAREVRLRYIRMLASISSASSPAEVIGSLNYLAYKTAEHGARFIGRNPVDADNLAVGAAKHIDKLIGIGVRSTQNVRTRRRGFRLPGYRRSR